MEFFWRQSGERQKFSSIRFDLDVGKHAISLSLFPIKSIAQKNLTDVCVMEFEHGILIVGSLLYDTGEALGRRTETHVLSIEELQRLAKGG